MPKIVPLAALEHAHRMMLDGATIRDAGYAISLGRDALSRHLRRMGYDTRQGLSGREPGNKLTLPEEAICEAYREGFSELALSKRFKVNRWTISRVLGEHNVTRRTGSQANILRLERLTPAERLALVSRAHAAVRGKPLHHSALVLHALAHEKFGNRRQKGPGEAEIIKALQQRGHAVTAQKAIDVYSIDLALPTVAVEVTVGNSGRNRAERNRHRIEQIFRAGLNFAYVQFDRIDNAAIADCIDYVIPLIEAVSRQPATQRHYWVIRCSFQQHPASRNNGYYTPDESAPPELVTSVRKIELRWAGEASRLSPRAT